MPGRLQDKVCLITGAAGGQGQVAVDIFLKEGARVLASDRDANGRDALAASFAAGSFSATAHAAKYVAERALSVKLNISAH